MEMNGQTVKCPICGDPYQVMPFYAGDQSACSDCVRKAKEKTTAKWERR
jgi:hypothetical protein